MTFKPNSWKFTKGSKKQLRQYSRQLVRQGFRVVTLHGYTAKADVGGSKKFRKKLSMKRARASKRIMKKQVRRMDARLAIKIKAKGGKNPVASNNSKKGRAANRRATIYVN